MENLGTNSTLPDNRSSGQEEKKTNKGLIIAGCLAGAGVIGYLVYKQMKGKGLEDTDQVGGSKGMISTMDLDEGGSALLSGLASTAEIEDAAATTLTASFEAKSQNTEMIMGVLYFTEGNANILQSDTYINGTCEVSPSANIFAGFFKEKVEAKQVIDYRFRPATGQMMLQVNKTFLWAKEVNAVIRVLKGIWSNWKSPDYYLRKDWELKENRKTTVLASGTENKLRLIFGQPNLTALEKVGTGKSTKATGFITWKTKTAYELIDIMGQQSKYAYNLLWMIASGRLGTYGPTPLEVGETGSMAHVYKVKALRYLLTNVLNVALTPDEVKKVIKTGVVLNGGDESKAVKSKAILTVPGNMEMNVVSFTTTTPVLSGAKDISIYWIPFTRGTDLAKSYPYIEVRAGANILACAKAGPITCKKGGGR